MKLQYKNVLLTRSYLLQNNDYIMMINSNKSYNISTEDILQGVDL